MKKVYGIDLGTTNSCIAHVKGHNDVEVIPNESTQTTPSVVFFEKNHLNELNIMVGAIAQAYEAVEPERTVSHIKNYIGDKHYRVYIDNDEYEPEQISSYILKQVVQEAEKRVGEKIEDVVITVPAYFGVNEREATKRAGELAGLNVIDLINEPIAAAIAYGTKNTMNKRVLVYDLGGGTFDCTLIEVSPSGIEVIATGGQRNLGGKDWDYAIMEYLQKYYIDQTGNMDNILDTPETEKELRKQVEENKKHLIHRYSTIITYMHKFHKLRVTLSRELFSDLTKHLLEQTIQLTKRMLEEAREKRPGADKFDEIILVGGASRMLDVSTRLQQEFGIEPKLYDPDEAVAKGAAIYGQEASVRNWLVSSIADLQGKAPETIDLQKTAEQPAEEELSLPELHALYEQASAVYSLPPSVVKGIAETKVKNVTSKSFGIVLRDVVNNRDVVKSLIKKNATLPVTVTEVYPLSEDNQKDISIRIVENDFTKDIIPVRDSKLIDKLRFILPEGLSKNSKIEVKFNMLNDGRLVFQAIDLTTGKKVSREVKTTDAVTTEQ